MTFDDQQIYEAVASAVRFFVHNTAYDSILSPVRTIMWGELGNTVRNKLQEYDFR
jgi:hypothetical protein